MSSGFTVGGKEFVGTNGAVEAYVAAMATLAAERYGADDPLAAYLASIRENPSWGWMVSLDPWATDAIGRGRLLELLDGATDLLRRENVFTDYGKTWIESVVSAMRSWIATVTPAEPHAVADVAHQSGSVATDKLSN